MVLQKEPEARSWCGGPALPPSTSPALPSCPQTWAQLQGAWLGATARPEPNPQQSQPREGSSAGQGFLSAGAVARHWMEAVGSRCTLAQSQALGAEPLTGAPGDRLSAGTCCTGWCHQCHPCQGTADGCSTAPRAPGEMEEPLEGCRGGGSSTAAPMPQVPAGNRRSVLGAGCGAEQAAGCPGWLWALGKSWEVVLGAGCWCWCPDAVSGEMLLCITHGAAECWHHSGHQLLQ